MKFDKRLTETNVENETLLNEQLLYIIELKSEYSDPNDVWLMFIGKYGPQRHFDELYVEAK